MIQLTLKKKRLDYCILQFKGKKKNQLKKKLTIKLEMLREVSCSFSPEVKPDDFFLKGRSLRSS